MESTTTDGSLDDVAVAKLGGHAKDRGSSSFWVGDYQRGYRWGPDEARDLLDDITQRRDGERYYLQPIVVKKQHHERPGPFWELVDGQQRLTTLFLLQRYLEQHRGLSSGPTYEMHYETRPDSAKFLNKMTLDEGAESPGRNIDFHHMSSVYATIHQWCTDNDDQVGELAAALKDDVRLLWFEVPTSVSAEAMFRRLNSGRIPLTDAELLKARFISALGSDTQAAESFAAQWDTFERDLGDDELWAFLGGGDPSASRIQLLLDTLADIEAPPPSPRPAFRTFHVLEDALSARDVGAETAWDWVVGLHSRIRGWFSDPDLYHWVGYLRATRQIGLGELEAWARSMTAQEFRTTLVKAISATIPATWEKLLELSYENARQQAELQRALLLMSVETVRRAGRGRFPFSEHQVGFRAWSLEHVHAQHSKSIEKKQQEKWLQDHQRALKIARDQPGENAGVLSGLLNRVTDALDPLLELEGFDALKDDVLVALTPADFDVDQMHSVSNLALLSREHNSALNNSAFTAKRARIIDMDRAGEYVPVATRNLFLKYYTESDLPQLYQWSDEDRKGYLANMEKLLYPKADVS